MQLLLGVCVLTRPFLSCTWTTAAAATLGDILSTLLLPQLLLTPLLLTSCSTHDRCWQHLVANCACQAKCQLHNSCHDMYT